MQICFFFSEKTTSIIGRLLKRGFQHVEAISCADNEGIIMHINPKWGRVDIAQTIEYDLHHIIEQMQKLGYRAVLIEQDVPDPKRKIRRGPIVTCATYLAYTYGIPFSGITPHQLYKTLKARGGKDL